MSRSIIDQRKRSLCPRIVECTRHIVLRLKNVQGQSSVFLIAHLFKQKSKSNAEYYIYFNFIYFFQQHFYFPALLVGGYNISNPNMVLLIYGRTFGLCWNCILRKAIITISSSIHQRHISFDLSYDTTAALLI